MMSLKGTRYYILKLRCQMLINSNSEVNYQLLATVFPATLETCQTGFISQDSGTFNCTTPRGLQNSIRVVVTSQLCPVLAQQEYHRYTSSNKHQ